MTLVVARSLREGGKHEEARQLLVSLATTNPQDAELQYETACVHDFLGYETQAVPYYIAALRGCLSRERLRRAYLGLGSTYRTLGRYDEAHSTLSAGLKEFPEANEMKLFLAIVEYNLGKSKAAVESLLDLLVQTTSDDEIRRYAKAIEFYAKNVDRAWPET